MIITIGAARELDRITRITPTRRGLPSEGVQRDDRTDCPILIAMISSASKHGGREKTRRPVTTPGLRGGRLNPVVRSPGW